MIQRLKSWIPLKVRVTLRQIPWVRFLIDRVGGRAYYCRALSGESNYNICINCDLTVSCNCRDYDGTGHIGDLRVQTLQEIFRGPQAVLLRRTLAKGRLPLSECVQCSELRATSREEAEQRATSFHTPISGIMVENTVVCNLRCLACRREEVVKTRSQTRMSLEDMSRVATEVRACGIQEVTFHNLGEPFASATIPQELGILKAQNPGLTLVLSTNGHLLDNDQKREAALMLDSLVFSIDGPSNEIAALYQRGCDFEKACTNLRKMVEYRDSRGLSKPIIEWKYVVFGWNDRDEHIERAVDLARDAGVDLISFWVGGLVGSHASRRFPQDPFFQSLGVPSWKGREVYLRKPQG